MYLKSIVGTIDAEIGSRLENPRNPLSLSPEEKEELVNLAEGWSDETMFMIEKLCSTRADREFLQKPLVKLLRAVEQGKPVRLSFSRAKFLSLAEKALSKIRKLNKSFFIR